MNRFEFIKKLHPAITHCISSDSMSEETLNAINATVEKVLNMTPSERAVLAGKWENNRLKPTLHAREERKGVDL